MTKVQNPIVGRARGSAGGMTFAKNYDKNVMRAKPFEVKNPNTTAQTTQRDFFKQVQQVVSSVSDEQLRSLFGDMPKGMSRRNALSKQVAAAFSVNGNTKSVDFSKLQAIGNGEKVYTPIEIVQDGSLGGAIYKKEMFGTNVSDNTPLVLVQFDTDNNNIVLFKSSSTVSDIADDSISSLFAGLTINNGYLYVTCPTTDEPIVQKGFGSFIIKTRAEKTGRNASGDTPAAGNTITVNGTAAGSTATINFGNYQFNSLEPGGANTDIEGEGDAVLDANEWVDNDNGTYSQDTDFPVENGEVLYVDILQNGEAIERVPFQVIVNP